MLHVACCLLVVNVLLFDVWRLVCVDCCCCVLVMCVCCVCVLIVLPLMLLVAC